MHTKLQQGHEAWVKDVKFGENKKWAVSCDKVCNPYILSDGITENLLPSVSLPRVVW